MSSRPSRFAALLTLGLAPVHAGEWIAARNPEGGYAGGLSVSPAGPELVFTKTLQRMARSTDGGRSWVNLTVPVLGLKELFYDPHEPARLYGLYFDLLYFSADSGATWTRAPSPLDEGGAFGLHLHMAFDTTRPGRAYVLVLEDGILEPIYRIYRTDNGGRDWSLAHDFGSDVEPTRLVLPTGSATLLASTYGGVLRSTDHGASFHPVLPGHRVSSFARNPNQNDRVYALLDGRLLVAQNDGQDWVRRDLPATPSSLQVAGTAPERLVLTSRNKGVWISADRGRAWSRVDSLPETHSASGAVVAPWDERILLVTDSGGLGVHRSIDAGQTWQASNRGLQAPIDRLHVHPDPSAPMLAESLEYLYSSADHGTNWERLSAPRLFSGFRRVAVSPSNPDWILLVDQQYDRRLRIGRQSRDGGQTWTRFELPETMYGFGTFAVSSEGAFVLSDSFAHYVSFDEGRHWTRNPFPDNSGAVQVEQQPPSRLFYLSLSGLRISYDYGLTWSANTLQQYAHEIAVHPRFPLRLYVASDTSHEVGFFHSTDAGRSWIRASSSSGLDLTGYRSATIDSTNDNRIAVLSTGWEPYLSEDGGRTFEPMWDGTFDENRYNLIFDPRDGKLWSTDIYGLLSYYEN